MADPITTNELGTKAKSKNEIYHLLATEGNVYLPPQNESNHYSLSDIISGKTKVSDIDQSFVEKHVKSDRVRMINVPHIKWLTAKDILAFSRSNSSIEEYLLEYKPPKYPSRPFLWNLNKPFKMCTNIQSTRWFQMSFQNS